MRLADTTLVLTFALIAACGNGEGRDAAEADTVAAPAAASAPVTVPAPAGEPSFVAVTLPPDFPSDFPLPPDHIVIEATSSRDVAGVYTNIALVVTSSPDDQYAWYRSALSDAGWQIAAEGRSDGTRSLHATQGESYIDLSIRPHPAQGAEGWVLTEASIWKLEGAGP